MIKDIASWERITKAFKNGCIVVKKEQKGIEITNDNNSKNTAEERKEEI